MDSFTGPAWVAVLATAAGYGVILAFMTVLFFGLPFVVYWAL